MYFVFFGKTTTELAKADAIACEYIEAIRDNREFWNAKSFVINTELSKTAEFWLSNADKLAEAIAANQCQPKTIEQLNDQDYAAMNGFQAVKPLPPN